MAVGGRCRSCSEPLLFMKNREGKPVPVELNSCAADDDEDTLFDPKRHTNHFERCPNAAGHRKGKKKPDPWSAPSG